MTTILIIIGKLVAFMSRITNKGNGSTWPGHIALFFQKTFIKDILANAKTQIILIAGTNGKTTTSKMITTILKEDRKTAFTNESGANLLNGIASALLLHTRWGKLYEDYAIFEVDENSLSFVLQELTPKAIILLNLFRDQLDRYGELDTIAKKWKESFSILPKTTTLIINADDPLVSYLGNNLQTQVLYFGLDEKSKQKKLQHASDSVYCPRCNKKLTFHAISYAHVGNWYCPNCQLKRPKITINNFFYPLAGTYNAYNTLAAVLAAKVLGVSEETTETAIKTVTPAFGRQEKLQVDNKNMQIFLAKNPAGFNENLQTVRELGVKRLLIVLNDRIPDGRDVSWIWDIDFEQYVSYFNTIYITGERVYDMALRIAYANVKRDKIETYENLQVAITQALEETNKRETLAIFPTYSAMLEVRKILTGRKIL
jgi:UDP-N-acetylmuramyl tripeptide synthase